MRYLCWCTLSFLLPVWAVAFKGSHVLQTLALAVSFTCTRATWGRQKTSRKQSTVGKNVPTNKGLIQRSIFTWAFVITFSYSVSKGEVPVFARLREGCRQFISWGFLLVYLTVNIQHVFSTLVRIAACFILTNQDKTCPVYGLGASHC